jgi:hypothetical protein
VLGSYNAIDISSAVFAIGNGSDNSNRSNIFVIYKDGRASLLGSVLKDSEDKETTPWNEKNIVTVEYLEWRLS